MQLGRLCTRLCRFRCKSLFALVIKISFGCTRDFRVNIWGTSLLKIKLAGDLGNVIGATSIGGRRSDFFYSKKIGAGQFGTFTTISALKRPSAPPPESPLTEVMPTRNAISANGVRYRRLEKLRSGRTFWRCVDISPLTQSLCDPRAPEPSPNRRCQATCGEASSVVKILFRPSWDRAPPRQPRTSADGSFAGPSSDEDARSCGQGKYKPYVFCQTPQSISQVPVQ